MLEIKKWTHPKYHQKRKIKLDFKDSKYATGRRKLIAKFGFGAGTGKIYVNGKLYNEYFSSEFHHPNNKTF